jgi:hypothetical protein
MAAGNADEAAAHDAGFADAADRQQWAQERRTFEHTRLDKVQAASRVWLGVLTTLVGLSGSVVLVKGNTLLTGLTSSRAFQWATVCLIAVGFLFSVLAIISGAAASWGGLSAVGHGEQPRWRKAVFWLILLFAFDKGTMPAARIYSFPDEVAEYRDQYERAAVSRRNLLQASRALGAIAAATVAVLAVVILLAGAVAPAPTDVIVIRGGRPTCEPVSAAQKETGVTRIIPVSQC